MINLEEDLSGLKFEDHIKKYMTYGLESLEGTTTYCYGSDLVDAILESDNRTGAIYVATADNIDFIKEYWDEAAKAAEYAKDEFGMTLNPFENPEQMVFIMYQMGLENLVSEAESPFLEEHWDDEINLNESNVNIIKKELGLEYDRSKIKDEAESEEA